MGARWKAHTLPLAASRPPMPAMVPVILIQLEEGNVKKVGKVPRKRYFTDPL